MHRYIPYFAYRVIQRVNGEHLAEFYRLEISDERWKSVNSTLPAIIRNDRAINLNK